MAADSYPQLSVQHQHTNASMSVDLDTSTAAPNYLYVKEASCNYSLLLTSVIYKETSACLIAQ